MDTTAETSQVPFPVSQNASLMAETSSLAGHVSVMRFLAENPLPEAKRDLLLHDAKRGPHLDHNGELFVPFERLQLLVHETSMGSPKKRVISANSHQNVASLSPVKKVKLEQGRQQSQHQSKNSCEPRFADKPLADNLDDEMDTTSRVALSSLFLPQSSASAKALLAEHGNRLKMDIPLDTNGQTALHLAATLGRTSLVKELVDLGGCLITRGDLEGQTALVRAIMTTNCYELGSFDKLLDELYQCLNVLDNRGRSVLHHVAMNCGLKGRDDASKYYLATMLEWIVTKGQNLGYTLDNFRTSMINLQDKYGNTCLNYATFTGDKYLVSQLLDIGADPNRANKIGVKPGDWGVDMVSNNTNSNINNKNNNNNNTQMELNGKHLSATDTSTKVREGSGSGSNDSDNESIVTEVDGTPMNTSMNNTNNNNANTSIGGNNNSSNIMKSSGNAILESIQSFITNLGERYQEDLQMKTNEIEKLNPIFKSKTTLLSQKRKQYDELEKMVRRISDINSKLENLDKAIVAEKEQFEQEASKLGIPLQDNDSQLGNYDADQPFIIDSIYPKVEEELNKLLPKVNNDGSSGQPEISSDEILAIIEQIKPSKIELSPSEYAKLPSTNILNARIEAYERNNAELLSRLNEKKKSSLALEQQFKRIIALCIGCNVNQIDDKLLGDLLLSVENEPDPEIGEIKKVLKIVNDLSK